MTVKENRLSLADHDMNFGLNRTKLCLDWMEAVILLLGKNKLDGVEINSLFGIDRTKLNLQQNIENRKLSIETLSHLLKACGLSFLCDMSNLQKNQNKSKRSGPSGPSGISGVLLAAIYCLLSRYKAPEGGWNGHTISNVWPTSTQKKWATNGPEAGHK